jgi:hypothetical protein
MNLSYSKGGDAADAIYRTRDNFLNNFSENIFRNETILCPNRPPRPRGKTHTSRIVRFETFFSGGGGEKSWKLAARNPKMHCAATYGVAESPFGYLVTQLLGDLDDGGCSTSDRGLVGSKRGHRRTTRRKKLPSIGNTNYNQRTGWNLLSVLEHNVSLLKRGDWRGHAIPLRVESICSLLV